MLLCNDFVFLHFPKTGGSFVTVVVKKVAERVPWFHCIDTEDEGTKHLGVDHIPAGHHDKQLVICVRNVFDHYISFYKFNWWTTHQDSVFVDERMQQYFPHYPDISFPEFVLALNDWYLTNRSDQAVREFTRHDVGYMTWFFLHLTKKNPYDIAVNLDSLTDTDLKELFGGMAFLHQENLNSDIHAFLRSRGLPEAELAFILEQAPENVTPDRRGLSPERRKNFTPEMARLILHKERLLFRLFPRYAVEVAEFQAP
jgi:hypothetical protein